VFDNVQTAACVKRNVAFANIALAVARPFTLSLSLEAVLQ